MVIGSHLGSYEILEEIGKGGMATLYRARQPSMDRDVAIKIIHGGLSDPAAVQRFQREARLIARLEHPHILPVYDFDGAHEPPYIVMRYLDGGTLETILERGPLPLADAALLMRQVCGGLDYAHRQGVIHRDIKPSNILIDKDGNAFVSDFGIARSAAGPASLRLTQEGMVLGSVEYISPEQIMGSRDLDHRADQYGLGVMLFQMLTGRLPFVSDPPLGVLAMHLSAPIPSASELNPEIPSAVDEVIQKALAKSPEERYSNTIQLSAALDAALGGSGMQPGLSPREGSYLREMAGLPGPGRVEGEPGLSATVGEQNRQIIALYANAAEHAEILEEAGGTEASHRSMTALWDAFNRVVISTGGLVLNQTDNDLLAVWGADVVHEDDAERAIHAALEMQSALREQAGLQSEDEQLPLNIGIHSGVALVIPHTQPDARTGTFAVTGATISLANRLMQAAYGTILITHEVYRQVRGVFDVQPDLPLRVRGRSEGVPTYRVAAAKPRAFRLSSRGVEGIETRMIGREAELRRLQHAFLNAIEDSETQVVTISGEAGVGKSRLLDTFEQWCELRPEMFYLFRGRAAGVPNRPYALLRDLVAFRFQVRDDDPPQVVIEKLEQGVAEMLRPSGLGTQAVLTPAAIAHRIGHLCGYNFSDSPFIRPLLGDPALLAVQLRQAFITFIAILARIDYVLIELEDLHLADDASLDLLNELFTTCAASRDDTRLVVVCTSRPALFSRRPDWGHNQPFHTRIDLQPLDRRESRELVREILMKVPDVPRALRDLLVERAGGNPYFLEELVKMLIDDRVILVENDLTWQVEESRLGALKVPPSLAALIEARLDTLLVPERLVLLRAAVFGRVFYSGVLLAMDQADVSVHGTATHIADLPGVLASLARREFIVEHETSAFTGSTEYAFAQSLLRDVVYEILAERQRRMYHHAAGDWLASLERADEYLTQIADHYELAGEWDEAAMALERAGERAYQRGLYREAEELYERGLAYNTEDDPGLRLDLLLGLGASANGRGDLPKAQPALEEALSLARSLNNTRGEASACCLLGMVETNRGNYQGAMARFDEVLPLARKKADRRVLVNVLYGLVDNGFRGGDFDKALKAAKECRELARSLGDEVMLGMLTNRVGTIYMLRQQTDEARAAYDEALALSRRLGHRRLEVAILINVGVLAATAGNWQEAAGSWETALNHVRASGDILAQTISASNLALAHVRLGELEKVRPEVVEALTAGRAMHAENMLVRGLLGWGSLKLAQGDVPGGFALIGLSIYHPAASSDYIWWARNEIAYWRKCTGLTEEQVEALLAAGKSLDLTRTVDGVMKG